MESFRVAPVLIVDDDELVRDILRRRLEQANMPVATAKTAEEALAFVEAIPVQAIVLDLHMPGRTGLDLAEFVRLTGAHLLHTPILIFTGMNVTVETFQVARRLGAHVYLKPDGLEPLVEDLRSFVDPELPNGIAPRYRGGGVREAMHDSSIPSDYTGEPES
jgi:CheY-like chemotaxis protein